MNEANAMEDITGQARLNDLEEELRALLNRHSLENGSDTPDFLLVRFMLTCLDAYARTVKARDEWFGLEPWTHRIVNAPPAEDKREDRQKERV